MTMIPESASASALPRSAAAGVAIACLSGLLFGVDMCVISGALGSLAEDLALGTVGKEAVVSSIMGGAAAGALLGGPAADAYGRKPAIAACALLFIVAATTMAAAPTVAVLVFGRFLCGLGVGASAMAVPVYLAEVAPLRQRGAVVSLNEVALCVGCLLAVAAGSALGGHPHGWRYLLGMPAVPALAQLLALPWLPESSAWLARCSAEPTAPPVQMATAAGPHTQPRREEERSKEDAPLMSRAAATADDDAVLQDGSPGLTGGVANVSPVLVASGPRGRLAKALAAALAPLQASWRKRDERAALLVCIGIAAAHNLTFSNALLYYSPSIYSAAGIPQPVLAALGVGAAKLGGVLLGTALMHRVDRRAMLIAGTAAEVACLLTLACTFWGLAAAAASIEEGVEPAASPATLRGVVQAALAVYVVAWNVSWAPLMFVCCAELLPARSRGAGMGLSVAAYWLTSVATNAGLLSMLEALTPAGTFTLIAGTSTAALVLVYLFVPESRGRSFEAIAQEFARVYGARDAETADATIRTRVP
jgi:MFS family permease